MSKSSIGLFVFAGLILAGVVGFAVWKSNAPSIYDGFAQCLTDKGVKMYGAWWCPHCKAQKDLFGNAFKKVTYVECSDANQQMTQVCTDAGIESFPTWRFPDGTELTGEQTFETLGEKVGCEVPKTQ